MKIKRTITIDGVDHPIEIELTAEEIQTARFEQTEKEQMGIAESYVRDYLAWSNCDAMDFKNLLYDTEKEDFLKYAVERFHYRKEHASELGIIKLNSIWLLSIDDAMSKYRRQPYVDFIVSGIKASNFIASRVKQSLTSPFAEPEYLINRISDPKISMRTVLKCMYDVIRP